MAEYKLSYKASEIDRKLGKVDTLVATVNGISPDENGNVEISVGSNITVDSSLSSTSENPVQNKVVSEKFDTKADTDHTHSDYALNSDLEDINNNLENSYITPQMYGAIGNGVADDTSALNAWFSAIATKKKIGYLPPAEYRITSTIGYAPSSHSNHMISFIGHGTATTKIKADFTTGQMMKFAHCYIGEIGGFTLDQNEKTPTESGLTGLYMYDMQYETTTTSKFHDIDIINVGQRAGLIYTTDEENSKAIKYCTFERVNTTGCTKDKTLWTTHSPVGIIAANVEDFDFINCKASYIKKFPFEFKNYTRNCSHQFCKFDDCHDSIYLGNELDANIICHRHYRAIGNEIINCSWGVYVGQITMSIFNDNIIMLATPEEGTYGAGFTFLENCVNCSGTGNQVHANVMVCNFKESTFNNTVYPCVDISIETYFRNTSGNVVSEPVKFSTNTRRCSLIVTNRQMYATEATISSNNNQYIPLANIDTSSGSDSSTSITVDSALSTTSTNPVQNKVIAAKINALESAQTQISPQAYGAVGDGVTDDTNAIKSCIEYANTNKLDVAFEHNKKYLVNNSSIINVETSIDFNGSTIILTRTATTPLFRIASDRTDLNLTQTSFTKYKVLDKRLYNKSFTIIAPLSLGLRNGTGDEHFYTQTLITDKYGYFISGTYNAEIVDGTYQFTNIQDSFQETLEFKNVTVDYSKLTGAAILMDCERNNVKIHNILITGSLTLSGWSNHVLALKNCCNNEIYDINATSPFDGKDASAYILGLYCTCNTFMHDCSLGGSLNTWCSVGVSYIDNFRAERVLTNRFDCHYFYNGDFIIRDSVFNYFYACGGNGDVIVENSTMIREPREDSASDNWYGLTMRHDLNLIPNGNMIFRNCKFYGITNTLLFYQQNRDDNILDKLFYKGTNIFIDNCFVDSDISFVRLELSEFFNNVNVTIKNCRVSQYGVRATGSAKCKNVEVLSCEIVNVINDNKELTTRFSECENLAIKNCYIDRIDLNYDTINHLIMTDNILTPNTTIYVKAKNAIIKNNIIKSDVRLVMQAENVRRIVNDNIMTSDTQTYLSTWNVGNNQTVAESDI